MKEGAAMSWQKELENGVRSMEQLAPKLGLSPEEAQRREEIAKRFPMMITPYYLSLVDTSDPDDPIGSCLLYTSRCV